MAGSARTSCRWRGGFCMEVTPLPCLVTVFGALGDLAGRKLFPSLWHLHRRKLLHEESGIIGCGREEMSDDAFRDYVRHLPGIEQTPELESFLRKIYYHAGDYLAEETCRTLAATLDAAERELGREHFCRIFYLATAPSLYLPLLELLHEAGLVAEPCKTAECGQWRHVVFEKPFGHDLASAAKLEQGLLRRLKERQIYRIDHYLGKETVQNILMFRFANMLFEPVWNRNYIDSVEITATETVGVEHRAGYFERAGLLRDMFQNHMLAMLSLVAMEMPSSFAADRVRDAKAALLRSLRPLTASGLEHQLVLGQYAAGNGMPGYREEPGVAPDSVTETYGALKLFIDNWRWQDVPFYLRSGKRLNAKSSRIVVNFKTIPHSIFEPVRAEDLMRNRLILTVQPQEGLALNLIAKEPGPKLCMGDLTMDFKYSSILDPGETMPEAYERLLLDCMLGDQTLFLRSDNVRLAWQFLMPALEAKEHITPFFYPAGSHGPAEADRLIQADGREWYESCAGE